MVSDCHWDQQIPLPKLGPTHSRIVVGLVALVCFINSYDGEFVFDDSEAIVNNKVLGHSSKLITFHTLICIVHGWCMFV